jgi:hypothetical protein
MSKVTLDLCLFSSQFCRGQYEVWRTWPVVIWGKKEYVACGTGFLLITFILFFFSAPLWYFVLTIQIINNKQSMLYMPNNSAIKLNKTFTKLVQNGFRHSNFQLVRMSSKDKYFRTWNVCLLVEYLNNCIVMSYVQTTDYPTQPIPVVYIDQWMELLLWHYMSRRVYF